MPSDRAVYGSKNGKLDKAEAAANRSLDATAVLVYWDLRGWETAPKLFREYLNNHGSDYEYRFTKDQMWQITRTANVRNAVTRCLESVKDQARTDPQTGVTREITSDWYGNVHTDDDGDLSAALGHFDVAVGSDTTVYKSDDGSGLRAEIRYKIYVYDFYNFDFLRTEGPVPSIPNNINNEMRELEEVGWARSFKSRGESDIQQWSGVL
ncbi:hypothetical protein [Nocardia sp. NBC_01009]|uniref:hypothetical protein n=1 Tax=Nocardia sp. NBC_01009 TaxID=2975996 RepID=UPI00386B02CC|nr:hypothetical protein OHA42_34210 [Nocardia sp. NBC_01009]